MRKFFKHFMHHILIFLLGLKLPGGICLHMVNFYVPEFANRGEKIILQCGFALDSELEDLYTVKWYKYDGKMSNFYTYSHTNHQTKKHKIDGVKVVLRESNANFLTLKQLRISSSGTYKCEVTTRRKHQRYQYYNKQGNPPRFNVIEKQARMQVIEIPKDPPVIGGGLRNYIYGDELNLNCTSKPSYPPTILTWYINEKRAGDSLIDDALMYREDDLFVTTSFLNIKVQPNLFRFGEIQVRCEAELTEEPIKASLLPEGDGFMLNQMKVPEAQKLSSRTVFEVPMFGRGSRTYHSTLFVYSVLLGFAPFFRI